MFNKKNCMKIFFKFIIVGLVLSILSHCVKPDYLYKTGIDKQKKGETKDIIPIFLEGFEPGGYSWGWPENYVIMPTDETAYEDEASLLIQLDSSTYSGGAIYFPTQDLTDIRNKAALIFYVRSDIEGLLYNVSLQDGESDGKGARTGIDVQKTTKKWKKIIISL